MDTEESRLKNIVLFGPPGVGKGAQADMISRRFGLEHLSTGELLREEIKRATPLGLRVKEAVSRGQFADDETVLGIILGRIDLPEFQRGFVMDGFPRNVRQAEMLERLLAERSRSIDGALFINAPEDVILRRLKGRRICSVCGATYHAVFKKPQVEGACDICNGAVVKRHDDDPATHRERLLTYHEKTKPLADFYRRTGALVDINGDQTIEEVAEDIADVVKGVVRKQD